WGITTNGLAMTGPVQKALLAAEYVHVSLDAGTDETYQRLKNGRPGQFAIVLRHLKELVGRRTGVRPQIIVSVLLQSANYHELLTVGQQLKERDVDSLEIKMQHFDPERHMLPEEVDAAYRGLE